MADIWDDINKYYEIELRKVANRCREILQDAIQSELYDKYTPKSYDRTYQLLNSVRTDIKDGYLYVYVNTGNLNYKSNVPNNNYPASKWTPYWTNYGHNKSIGGKFMYDNYPSRSYLQVAKERIKRELGLDIEIMSENV